MEKKVLVVFASMHGATEEIAQVVAETLREQGLIVDLEPARNVRLLDGIGAVVLGAPLYMFHVHRDGLRFLARHRKALARIPVAVFAGGPFGVGEGDEWQEVRAQLDRELAKFDWLMPVATLIVGGRFDPTRLRFPYNLLPALKMMSLSDLRDWDAIRTWAVSLADIFTKGLSGVAAGEKVAAA